MTFTQQPQPFGMQQMGGPPQAVPTGVPPGLEFLVNMDRIIIKQRKELFEILTGCESRNKYDIFLPNGQQVGNSFEESDTCHRMCCGPGRGFIFHVVDMNGREILRLDRPFKCCVGCPCCADSASCQYPINIYDGQGQALGMTRMNTFCCDPRFGIFETSGNQMYSIHRDCCVCQCCCYKKDIDHPIFSMHDNSQVGNIAKQWAGTFTELFTDADTFCVSFPMDMHIMHKTLLFASMFLVEMTLYENQDGGGGA